MPDDEKIIEKVGVKFEVDESSKDAAIKALEQVGDSAQNVQKEVAEGNQELGKFAEFLGKDFKSAAGGLLGQFGEIAQLLRAGGPIAAGAVAFSLIEGRASELAKNAVDVNRQFEALKETSKDIAKIWVELKDLGFSNEQSSGVIVGLTKTGAFPNKEMLREATQSSAALSKQTGIPIEDISNIVAQAVRLGALEPGNIGGGLVNQNKTGLLQNLIKGADEAEMSLQNYSKSVFDLWQTTKNYNVDFLTTSKILNSWSEELNKGLMTISDLANLAGGQTMSESQKVFAAQQMGIGGSPLEMMTRFEELMSSDKGIDKLGKFVFDRANQMARSPEELIQFVRMFNQTLAGGAFTEVRSLRGAAEFIDRFGTDERRNEIREAFKSAFDDKGKAEDEARKVNTQHTEQVLKDLDSIQDILDTIKINTSQSRSMFEGFKATFDNVRTLIAGQYGNDAPATISEVKQSRELDRKALMLDSRTARAESDLFGIKSPALKDALSESIRTNGGIGSSGSGLPTIKTEHETTIKVISDGQPVGEKKSKKAGQQSFVLPGALTTQKVQVE